MRVQPPSGRQELAGALRGSAAIVIVAGTYIAFSTGGTLNTAAAPGPAAGLAEGRAGDLFPYQELFSDLPPEQQRVYRQIQEGSIEVENLRAARGDWPDVATLSAQGIPPFTPDPLDRERKSWTVARSGSVATYLGLPAVGSPGPAWLLHFRAPEPSEGLGPTEAQQPADEVHHRLPDGTLLHVTLWRNPQPDAESGGPIELPVAKGWTQVLVSAASNR